MGLQADGSLADGRFQKICRYRAEFAKSLRVEGRFNASRGGSFSKVASVKKPVCYTQSREKARWAVQAKNIPGMHALCINTNTTPSHQTGTHLKQ